MNRLLNAGGDVFVLDGDYLIPWCKDNYFLDKNKKYRANSCIVIINENTLHHLSPLRVFVESWSAFFLAFCFFPWFGKEAGQLFLAWVKGGEGLVKG